MFKILITSSLLAGSAMAACDTDKLQEVSNAAIVCHEAAGEDDVKETCKCSNTYLKDMGKMKDCIDDGLIDADQLEEMNKSYKEMCPGCFPATATVELISGKTKTMDQLVAGDQVRVGVKEFSEVYFFSTQLEETTSKFVKIATEHGPALSLTSGHYLYVNGHEVRQADDVKVGDVVILANGTKSPVVGISAEWGPGLYNPHTLHGDVVVDGILTSTYTAAVHPTLAHALLMPLRQLYSAGVTFGEAFNVASKALPSYILKAINA
jgi:hypothetical protein